MHNVNTYATYKLRINPFYVLNDGDDVAFIYHGMVEMKKQQPWAETGQLIIFGISFIFCTPTSNCNISVWKAATVSLKAEADIVPWRTNWRLLGGSTSRSSRGRRGCRRWRATWGSGGRRSCGGAALMGHCCCQECRQCRQFWRGICSLSVLCPQWRQKTQHKFEQLRSVPTSKEKNHADVRCNLLHLHL